MLNAWYVIFFQCLVDVQLFWCVNVPLRTSLRLLNQVSQWSTLRLLKWMAWSLSLSPFFLHWKSVMPSRVPPVCCPTERLRFTFTANTSFSSTYSSCFFTSRSAKANTQKTLMSCYTFFSPPLVKCFFFLNASFFIIIWPHSSNKIFCLIESL